MTNHIKPRAATHRESPGMEEPDLTPPGFSDAPASQEVPDSLQPEHQQEDPLPPESFPAFVQRLAPGSGL